MFSPKRAAAVKNGDVVFNIYDNKGKLVFSFPTFIQAVKYIEFLQDSYPNDKYDLKVEIAKGDKL